MELSVVCPLLSCGSFFAVLSRRVVRRHGSLDRVLFSEWTQSSTRRAQRDQLWLSFRRSAIPHHNGRDASIDPEASIPIPERDPQSPDFALCGGDVAVGDRVWIGYRALVLPGVAIGDGAVVAAGAVVTKSVERYTIVGENPVGVIGQRNRELSYKLNFRPPLQ